MDGSIGRSQEASYLEHYLSGFEALLTDPAAVEVAINPDGSVWVLKRCDIYMRDSGGKIAAATARSLCEQIAGENQTQLGRNKLMVSATVAYRGRPVRAQCILPPATPGHAAISLRLFASLPIAEIELEYVHGKPLSLTKERRERNSRLKAMLAESGLEQTLRFCVEQKLNIVISGGTDTGKSVALRKIISMIAREERLITIEDAPELYPAQPNTVSLIADRFGDSRTADQLLEATLRMRPDRIIVGEVRGKEAMTFLEAINTGHGGSMTTLHAETPVLALDRLAIAAGKADAPMNYAEIRHYIKRSIDVIIQTGRVGTRRGVVEVYVPELEEES